MSDDIERARTRNVCVFLFSVFPQFIISIYLSFCSHSRKDHLTQCFLNLYADCAKKKKNTFVTSVLSRDNSNLYTYQIPMYN